jgi:ubiquinone biosynthesis protein
MGVVVSLGGMVASLARMAAIAVITLGCALVFLGGALRRLAIRDPIEREQHRARQLGRLLRWSFSRLGATFIKVGQVMSSRPDVFPPGVIDELRSLQDRVPPFPSRRVPRVVARGLGCSIAVWFRAFDREPIAAGSIAQVHHAVLHTGEEVAVKVVRPGVRAHVRRDARILLWFAHVAQTLSPRARAADTVGHVRSLIVGIMAQTDLRAEAHTYERFREEFAAMPGLAFPHVYHATRDVLVMEFVHGVRFDQAPADQLPTVARVLRETFFAMCFDHGHVHADLHPGNVLVRPDGVVVLLDVGLVKHLSRPVIDQIVDFARCMVIGDALDLVGHLKDHHRYLEGTDWAAVARDARTFVDGLRRRSIAELEVSLVVGQLFALARRHGIRPIPDLSLVLLGMVTIEGIAKRLDPTANTMTEIAKFLGTRAVHDRRLARGSRELTLPTLRQPAADDHPAAAPATREPAAAAAPAIGRTRTRRVPTHH